MVSNTPAQATTFAITDTKLYGPVLTLSTQDHAKFLQQLKSCFKITISWNKYQSEVTIEAPNPYLDYLIYENLSFHGANRLFVLSFGNNANRAECTKYNLPTVGIKDYNVMIEEQSFFDQPVINNLITYDKIQITATNQRDDFATGWLRNYNYFNKYYKMIRHRFK